MRRKYAESAERQSDMQNGIEEKVWNNIDSARRALQQLAEYGIDVDSVIVTSTRGQDRYDSLKVAWSYDFFRGERNVATYIVSIWALMTQPGADGFGRKWGLGDQGESWDRHIAWERLSITQWL